MKLSQDQATVLLILPCWRPQPCFTQFVRLVKPGITPLLILAHRYLPNLSGANLQQPIWDRLNFAAEDFSGISQKKDVTRSLQDYLYIIEI